MTTPSHATLCNVQTGDRIAVQQITYTRVHHGVKHGEHVIHAPISLDAQALIDRWNDLGAPPWEYALVKAEQVSVFEPAPGEESRLWHGYVRLATEHDEPGRWTFLHSGKI